MSQLSILGRGWPFPIVPARTHGFDYVQGASCVEQAIRLILDTDPGERLMRPTFGAGLRRYLQQPNTVAVRALIEHDVGTALALWEPRISVRGVDVDPGEDPALVVIQINYVHVRDQRPGNFVYPFYLR
jgi:uncharacterized protein